LRIVGDGPEYRTLKRMAGPTVEFLGTVSDHEVQEQLSDCRAFLLPGEEDFGIAPLEAQGRGRPVIAIRSGGALETVRGVEDSKIPTGLFFDEQSPDSLAAAMLRFEKIGDKFVPSAIREHALKFDKANFQVRMADFIDQAIYPLTEHISILPALHQTRKSGRQSPAYPEPLRSHPTPVSSPSFRQCRDPQ